MTMRETVRARRWSRRWPLGLVLLVIAVAAPATATDQFGDVSATSAHHDAIGELFGTGITAGCADGRYCPDQPVARDQMASFLQRGLPRAVSNSSVASLSSANDYSGVPASVTVQATGVAGGRGMVTLQGSVSVIAEGDVSSCPCEVEAFVYRDGDDVQGPSMWTQLPGDATGDGRAVASVPVSWTVTIPSGSSETFRIAVLLNDGSPSGVTTEATLAAVTVPLS